MEGKKLYRTFAKRFIIFLILLLSGSGIFPLLERNASSSNKTPTAMPALDHLVNLFSNLSSSSINNHTSINNVSAMSNKSRNYLRERIEKILKETSKAKNTPSKAADSFYKAEHLSFTILFTIGKYLLFKLTKSNL